MTKNNDIDYNNNKSKKNNHSTVENNRGRKQFEDSSVKSSNNNNYNKKVNNFKKNKINEDDLDLTNVAELTFDEVRLSDAELLDTSFLDGKPNKKKKDKMVREAMSDEIVEEKKHKKSGGSSFFTFLLLIVILLGLLVFLDFDFDSILGTKTKIKTVTKEVTKTVVDDNFLFLGDAITEGYDLSKYYEDFPVVNSGNRSDTSDEVLEDLEKRVYQYNPSDVFIHIGENDMASNISKEDTITNITGIIEGIKKNRPYCNIYLESIYPINDTDGEGINNNVIKNRNNEEIKEVNEELKKLAKSENVTYIDVYSLLQDEDGNLRLDYTKDGFHLSLEGYNIVTKDLIKYIR